jgi:DNA polymerase I-like protein with 3'-5' exonuclease and polymerase domains
MPPNAQKGSKAEPDAVEMECCRSRIVEDIERTKPAVVVGIGDLPLHWATGLPRNALTFRGTKIATKIGKHVCWYYPIIYPNYAEKEKASYNKSEYELCVEHDVDFMLAMLDRGDLEEAPHIYQAPYDTGISMITGQEPGDFQRLEDAFHRLLKLKAVGLDIETSDLSPYVRDPRIWTAAVGSFADTVAFTIDHPDGWGSEAQMKKVRNAFGQFLLESGRKRCHNAQFEQLWLGFEYGHKMLRMTEWEDTQALCHTLDERKGTKSLDVQCRVNFGFFLKDQSKVDVSQKGWITRHSVQEVLRYNGLDTKWTDRLCDTLLPRVQSQEVFESEYERKMRLTPTLVGIQHKGMPVNLDVAEKLDQVYGDQLTELEAKIRRTQEVKEYTSRYGSFDPGNADHVLKLMKVVCQREEVYVEERGVVRETSDETALNRIPAKEVPSAPMILEHRALSKNRSTYLAPVLNKKLVSFDGIMHAPYDGMEAVTGRLSSLIHNWPKRKYREVRSVVQSREWEWILACDYGQIEFRVAGMLTLDEAIVSACWTNYDVHKFWAERLIAIYPAIKDLIVAEFGIDWDEKGLKTLRQEMKNKWVFPQIFGSAVRSCAENLKIPEQTAERLAEEFWDTFAATKRWQEKLLKSYEKKLYVETLGGRRRRGAMTKNEAINMPIQGTACDIVTAAMDALSEIAIQEDDPDYQNNFNGHDDLSFLLRDDVLEQKCQRIVYEMCRPRFEYINVPIVVEASVGHRWDKLQEIGVYRSNVLFNTPNPYA